MCQISQSLAESSPEELLARLLKKEVGADINPQALRMFIRSKWDRVSTLAHLIHDEAK